MNIAKTSELRQVVLKDDPEAVLQLINLGLIELYKRFPILTEEQILTLDGVTSVYTMDSNFMWIVAAYEEVPENTSGYSQLPINDEENPYSVNTVSWNKVQIPLDVSGAHISIVYAASPKWVTYDSENSTHENATVELPPQLLDPLLHYIGYKGNAILNNTLTQEEDVRWKRFAASCNNVEKRGMFTVDAINLDGRLLNRGFE